MKKISKILACSLIFSFVASIGSTGNQVEAKSSSIAVSKENFLLTEEAIRSEPAASTVGDNSAQMEKVLRLVKGIVTIPKEYSEFSYYYNDNSYSKNQIWNFTWRNPKDGNRIRVNSDGNGNISYYEKSNYEREQGVASYLKKELEKTAASFIKSMNPTIANKISLFETNYTGIHEGNYEYQYVRMENGIQLPDNFVTVYVDSISGEVARYNVNWNYETKVPSSKAKLTKEEAYKTISQQVKMNLSYRMNYQWIGTGENTVLDKKAYLVYEPSQTYIAVNAVTGEVYNTKSEWNEKETTKDSAAANEMATGSAMKDGGLTQQELDKIADLQKLISKQKAIDIISNHKKLYIDKSLNSYDANLEQVADGQYVWYISLNDSRPYDVKKEKEYYRAYANATVDAKTGKILSFSASIKSNYDSSNQKWNTVKVKYDAKAAQEILEKFIKESHSDQFKKTKLSSQTPDYIAFMKNESTPVYGGYRYNYNRFNEGIEFVYNSINGSVDGVTGKIYEFNVNWDDNIVFESPKKAISPEKAFEYYMKDDGFKMVYEINQVHTFDPNYKGTDKFFEGSDAYSYKEEIRLVYSTNIYPYMISPFTGEKLDYSGDVYQVDSAFSYTDITDTDENRNILLFADMNIGFEGPHFLDKNIVTPAELESLLTKIGYYSNSDSPKIQGTTISREELAYYLVNLLGLKEVAALKGIYLTGYLDQHNIQPLYHGSVAIAKGFGFITEDAGNLLNPTHHITRREIMDILVKFLDAANKLR